MNHLVRVEVIGDLPIVSVTGYRDEQEVQFDSGGKPLFDADGNPVVKTVQVTETVDVEKGGIAYLDPEQTNIAVLTQARLVKVLPKEPGEADKKAKKAA